MTANPVETVETIASYARRAGNGVRLVLHLPDVQGGEGAEAQIRLTSGRGSVRANATVTAAIPGVHIETTIPAKRLPPSVWRIAVRLDSEGPFRRVQARLLTSRTQPIALLPGPAPKTLMDPPPVKTRKTRKARPRVMRGAARMVDQALGVLPAERATRYRASLRKSARRILG